MLIEVEGGEGLGSTRRTRPDRTGPSLWWWVMGLWSHRRSEGRGWTGRWLRKVRLRSRVGEETVIESGLRGVRVGMLNRKYTGWFTCKILYFGLPSRGPVQR